MRTIRTVGLFSVCAVAAVVATAGGCAVGGAEEGDDRGAQSTDVPPVFLEQGWDAATRTAFYTTTQGSRMLPYSWFINLEEAGSRQKFKAPSNMRRMGFLVDTDTAANPDQLPVGFTKDTDAARGDAIGLSCAACHTGELRYAGKSVRIDGGQSLGDLEQLQNGLHAALTATLDAADKFDRFADNVLGKDSDAAARTALRASVVVKRDWWARRIARSKGLSAHGPSRTDAFTIIGNEVLCELLNEPRNCQDAEGNALTNAVAPAQFPHLWGSPDFEWAQYNSSVHSPIGRNVGEVTGVFAEAKIVPIPVSPGIAVVSTARLHKLHDLEGWVKTLKAPKWPAEVLGPINTTAAAVGKDLYAANCAGCHNLEAPRSTPNAFGKTFAQMNFSTPLLPEFYPPGTPMLGTDPTSARAFAFRRAYPGAFTAIATANGLIGDDGKASAAALLSISGSLITQMFFAQNGFTDAQKIDYLSYRTSKTPALPQLITIKARPLDGIALTAPYLHNGSVSSLYELLLPPAERKKQFHVGNAEFDPIHVGYSTEKNAHSVLLDTTLPGNSNSGHYYGTNLTDGERMALVEYMKTL